jgi:hypothetical protein
MDGDLSPAARFEHRGFDTDCVLRQADSPGQTLTDHTLTDRSRGDVMKKYPVSTRVNSPQNDDPSCAQEVSIPVAQAAFVLN